MEAEAKKKVAEAEGIAKANIAIQQSMSANVIEWKRLDLQKQALEKWNGQLPYYSGGGNMPFIQIPSGGAK